MSLSNKVKDSLLSALGSNEARNELVAAIDAAGGNSISALTGDVSASGSGSVVATVNSVGGAIASSSNTPSTIVKRDSSGNFSAGTITANLTGNASLDLPLSGGTMSGAIAMGTNKVTGMGDPTLAQDAATKNYVDTHSSGQILAFFSNPVGAGSADAALTVTGLLSTDTILAATQSTRGATTAALIGWSGQGNNALTGHWSADPGGLAVVLVVVKR